MTRRAIGEGTVFQTTNGRWAAMVEMPRKANGKRQRKLRRTRTRTEAQRALAEMRAELRDHGALASGTRKLKDTIRDYVVNVRQPNSQTVSTREKDEMLAKAILKHMGNQKVAKLSVQHVEPFLKEFSTGKANASGKPVGQDYVRRARAFLKAALENDMRLGHLNRNVASIATMPETSAQTKPKRALSSAEWRKLYQAATGSTRLLLDLSGRHGLRPQEVRALCWNVFDSETSTISVVKQFDTTNNFVDPKTDNATRTIHAHPELAEALNQWRSKQQQQLLNAPTNLDLILATRNGTPISQENQRRSLAALCERTGIEPVTPYELRHTAITHQVEAGHSVTQIADWAGTSEKMIYEHYRHKLREVSNLNPPEY